MRQLLISNAADLADAIEDWIILNKCNPTTPEEWDRCISDLTKAGKLNYIGSIEEKDSGELKNILKENFNVKDINEKDTNVD